MSIALDDVKKYWDEDSCGERYAIGNNDKEAYLAETSERYKLEPYIKSFANFNHYKGLEVLEIGVGMGSDHSMIAQSNPKSLTGIDLTERAIEHTKKRFEALKLSTNLSVGNAQNLKFKDNTFDTIYSWVFCIIRQTLKNALMKYGEF